MRLRRGTFLEGRVPPFGDEFIWRHETHSNVALAPICCRYNGWRSRGEAISLSDPPAKRLDLERE
jgi:hypothetical protein